MFAGKIYHRERRTFAPSGRRKHSWSGTGAANANAFACLQVPSRSPAREGDVGSAANTTLASACRGYLVDVWA